MKTAALILLILDALAFISLIEVIVDATYFEKKFGSKYHHGSKFYNDKLKTSIAISDTLLYVVLLAGFYSFVYALVFGIMNY